MAIGLLALDIDGTLLNSQKKISRSNRRAIVRAVKRGIIVVLVTGRRFVIARPIALELDLEAPLITHNGALTKNARTLEVLDFIPLAVDEARRVIELGQEVGADLVCCTDPEGNGRAVIQSVSEQNIRLRRYLEMAPMVIEQVPDLAASLGGGLIQVMSAGGCEKMDQFEAVLRLKLKNRVKLSKTAYPDQDMTILDILTSACSKARALAAVVEQYGLSPAEVMAIGDNQNDLEMLAFAGLSVVMGNADHQLKQRGYAVTGSNDEDGVAQAIEKYLLT